MEDPGEVERAQGLPLLPWANDEADRWIGVSIDMISGRRVRPTYLSHDAIPSAHASHH